MADSNNDTGDTWDPRKAPVLARRKADGLRTHLLHNGRNWFRLDEAGKAVEDIEPAEWERIG